MTAMSRLRKLRVAHPSIRRYKRTCRIPPVLIRASFVSALLASVAMVPFSTGFVAQEPAPPLQAALATAPVSSDPDDPAIWIHPKDAAKSLILGTDKAAVTGSLHVFDLDGRVKQTIAPLDRPNNVDVEYGVRFGKGRVDIAVVTERLQHRLRVYAIPADGGALVDLAPNGIGVLAGQTGEASEPMGVAVYKRSRDGAVFAIVAPKTGATVDYLWQYSLQELGNVMTGSLVRRFGTFSGRGASALDAGEIEAVVVDDELGYVYYADEAAGIRKWQADPENPLANRELAVLGITGYAGDREGLAIYTQPGGRGFLISSDQIDGGTRIKIYRREGEPGRPHDQPPIATLDTTADATDGLDAVSRPLPGFPKGFLVMMNSRPRNFLVFDWAAIASRLPRPAGSP